jgi:hypothetical protein
MMAPQSYQKHFSMTLTPKYALNFIFGLLKGKNTVDDAEEDDAKDDVKAKAKAEVPGEGAAKNPNQASAIHPSNWFFHG